jgi:hypothetical protein
MLFSKAIIQTEWDANAPLREAMAIKRERWRARRAAIERANQTDPTIGRNRGTALPCPTLAYCPAGEMSV